MTFKRKLAQKGGMVSVGVLALALAVPAHGQEADTSVSTGEADAIIVTGFRASLDAALDVKRESVSAVDAVVAEDIAKFPDQNLAESLQRIPGISIQRDGGEGRAITVRGLGSQFTRVRLNGLETVTTTTDGTVVNRERAFDFNVFASELFNSIVVRKTAEASLDEGSLGAVVDLNTGNPLGGKYGFTAVLSAQGAYNDLSKNWGPRVAGLLSWKAPDGTFGVALSGAYSKTSTLEMGNNTGLWAQSRFDSVDGTPCFTTPNAGGSYISSPVCDKATLSFHPRIPRYGEISLQRERMGFTGSVQWSPSDATKVSIDALYSKFREARGQKWVEVLLRSLERPVDVVNPVYDDNNNMISATLNDAQVRVERFLRKSSTKFYQLGASWDQDIGDNFRFTLLGGFSKSNADIPKMTVLMMDDRDAQGFFYDYRINGGRSPQLTYGTSVTDPANFQLAEMRDILSNVTNKFRTLQLRTEWDVSEDFQVKAGAVYRRFDFASYGENRNTAVCGNGGVDRIFGTINCSPSSLIGPNAVYGIPMTAVPGLTEMFTLRNAGQPANNTNQWLVPSLDAVTSYTNFYSRPLVEEPGNNRRVTEEVTGGYLQVDAKGDLAGLRYALNAGIRYARTKQTSFGINSGTAVTVNRTYDDWLPSTNLALFPTDDLVIRAAAAKVITRPSLGDLTPGGAASGFQFTVNFGNPNLAPYRATTFDLAVEYYFAPQSIFSVALFQKNIASFPIAQQLGGQTFSSLGLPVEILLPSSPAFLQPELQSQPIWTVGTKVNGSGASLKGAEVSLQMPFRFLPGILKNFGGILNATFVDSSATYTIPGPATVARTSAGAMGPSNPVTRETTLYGLSKRAYNGTLYYEDSRFSARASISYRGPFVDSGSANSNVFEGFGRSINVDASVRYKFTDWLEVSLEGINLTDDYRFRYTDLDAQRNYENNHFGRTLLVGVRVKI